MKDLKMGVDTNKIRLLEKRLKKCPFCGGKGRILWGEDYISGSIFCRDCFCHTCTWSTFELAIRHWNCRDNKKCRLK